MKMGVGFCIYLDGVNVVVPSLTVGLLWCMMDAQLHFLDYPMLDGLEPPVSECQECRGEYEHY